MLSRDFTKVINFSITHFLHIKNNHKIIFNDQLASNRTKHDSSTLTQTKSYKYHINSSTTKCELNHAKDNPMQEIINQLQLQP